MDTHRLSTGRPLCVWRRHTGQRCGVEARSLVVRAWSMQNSSPRMTFVRVQQCVQIFTQLLSKRTYTRIKCHIKIYTHCWNINKSHKGGYFLCSPGILLSRGLLVVIFRSFAYSFTSAFPSLWGAMALSAAPQQSFTTAIWASPGVFNNNSSNSNNKTTNSWA